MICLRRSDLLATALLTSVGAVGTDKLSVSANLHRSLYLTLAICSLNVTSRGQDGKSQATEVYPCAKPLGDGLRRMEHHAYPQFTALLNFSIFNFKGFIGMTKNNCIAKALQ